MGLSRRQCSDPLSSSEYINFFANTIQVVATTFTLRPNVKPEKELKDTEQWMSNKIKYEKYFNGPYLLVTHALHVSAHTFGSACTSW